MRRDLEKPAVLKAVFAALVAGPVLFALTTPVMAQTGKPLPIQIESDTADFAQKSGVSTYTGNVHLTRGGLTLTGNKLVVTRINERGNIRAVLTGGPANIDKQPDSTSPERITGHAQRIEYTNANAKLTLRGNAVLTRAGGDTIESPVITRDLDTGQTQAQGSGSQDGQGRVHITIQPDENAKP